MENENFKEEKRFSRTVEDPKDMSIVNDNCIRNVYYNNSVKLVQATPDKENRSAKRAFACLQEEDEKGIVGEK